MIQVAVPFRYVRRQKYLTIFADIVTLSSAAEPAATANASPLTFSWVSMRQDESAWNLHGHRPRVKQFP